MTEKFIYQEMEWILKVDHYVDSNQLLLVMHGTGKEYRQIYLTIGAPETTMPYETAILKHSINNDYFIKCFDDMGLIRHIIGKFSDDISDCGDLSVVRFDMARLALLDREGVERYKKLHNIHTDNYFEGKISKQQFVNFLAICEESGEPLFGSNKHIKKRLEAVLTRQGYWSGCEFRFFPEGEKWRAERKWYGRVI